MLVHAAWAERALCVTHTTYMGNYESMDIGGKRHFAAKYKISNEEREKNRNRKHAVIQSTKYINLNLSNAIYTTIEE